MGINLRKLMTSERFYKVLKVLSDFILNVSEQMVKQWLGTVIGQRFFKWFTDMLVSRFFKEIVEPFNRVTIIKSGYYFDMKDAKNRIKKIEKVEDTDDEDLYLRTLNDVLRK